MKRKLEDFGRDFCTYVLALITVLTLFLYMDLNFCKESTEFQRTFNALGAFGYSVAARIQEYYRYFFILFPILFVLAVIFFSVVLKKYSKTKKVLLEFAGIYACCLPVFFLTKYSGGNSFGKGIQLPVIIVGSIILIACFARYTEQVLTETDYYAIAMLSFSEWLSLLCLTNQLGFFPILRKVRFLVFLFFFMMQLLFVYMKKRNGRVCFLLPVSNYLVWLPLVLCLTLEVLFSLIGRMQCVINTYACVCVVGIIWIAFSLYMGGRKEYQNITTSGYIGFLFSLGAMNAFPSFSVEMQNYLPDQLFELGNTTGFVDTLISGDLVGANYFSAHMLSDNLLQMVYYFFNHDLYGSILNNYAGLADVITIIMTFLLLKCMMKEKYAFLICCLLPVCTGNSFIIDLSFLPVLATFYLVKHGRKANYYFYWFSLLFGVFYQIDKGTGLGIGCILVLLGLHLFQKIKINWKCYLQAFFNACIVAFIYFLIGSLKDGVFVFTRILEFVIAVTKSNEVWAMLSTGDVITLQYFIVYCFLPLACIGIFMFLVFHMQTVTNENIYVYIACVVICVAQFLFASRTLVLYTLANGASTRFFSYFPWLVAFLCVYLWRTNEFAKAFSFCIGFLLTVFLQCGLVTGFETHIETIPLVSAEYASLQKDFGYDSSQGTDRTTLHPALEQDLEVFQSVFSEILEVEDTFIDFANVSGLYGLLYRERPFYVSQSPGLLTNEESQRMYINEIETNGKAKAVIMPNAKGTFLDGMLGIPHTQRYYLVAEYIYQNYQPLLTYKEYAIWVRNDVYEAARQNFRTSNLLLDDWRYGEVEALHTYHYGLYAWMWANKDVKNACNQEIQYECPIVENKVFFIDNSSIKKEQGNYLKCSINSPYDDTTIRINMLNDTYKVMSSYEITLKEGENNYLIRCSNDYSWYELSKSFVQFETEDDVEISEVKILMGD